MAYSVWLHRDHFELDDPWQHVDFQVVAAYDVVGLPGWNVSADPQPFAEMWLIREGTSEICLGDQTAVANQGDVVLLQPGLTRHTQEIAGRNLSIIGLSFHATVLGGIDFLKLFHLPLTLSFNTSDFSSFLHRCIQESRNREHGYSLAVQGLGQLALLEILRAQQARQALLETPSPLDTSFQVARSPDLVGVLDFVQQNVDAAMDVSFLAGLVHLSPKHFGRKFHAALGMPPMEYVRRVRLNRARDMLASTQESAGQIASRCGFENAAHFSRAFKRQYGLSPVQYRIQTRHLNRTLQSKKPPFKSNFKAA